MQSLHKEGGKGPSGQRGPLPKHVGKEGSQPLTRLRQLVVRRTFPLSFGLALAARLRSLLLAAVGRGRRRQARHGGDGGVLRRLQLVRQHLRRTRSHRPRPTPLTPRVARSTVSVTALVSCAAAKTSESLNASTSSGLSSHWRGAGSDRCARKRAPQRTHLELLERLGDGVGPVRLGHQVLNRHLRGTHTPQNALDVNAFAGGRGAATHPVPPCARSRRRGERRW